MAPKLSLSLGIWLIGAQTASAIWRTTSIGSDNQAQPPNATYLHLNQIPMMRPRISLSQLMGDTVYEFHHYVEDFGKKYSASEFQTRSKIFHENLAHIKAHNSRSDTTYKKHINMFTDLSNEEFRRVTRGFNHNRHLTHHTKQARNMKTDPKPEIINEEHALKNRLPGKINHTRLRELPKSIDWRTDYRTSKGVYKSVVTEAKNQGWCGSCWTFSVAEALESRLAMATDGEQLLTLSEDQVLACTKNPDHCGGTGGCDGATPALGFEYVKCSGGLRTETVAPYESFYGSNPTCSNNFKEGPVAGICGYKNLKINDYMDLIEAIQNGPVAISVDAGGNAWQHYTGGVLMNTKNHDGSFSCTGNIDHAVTLVGYGVENVGGKEVGYWLVRNSWGTEWGEDGYIKLERDPKALEKIDPETGFPSSCLLDMHPEEGDACENDSLDPILVCGTCGILSASSVPVGVHLIEDGDSSSKVCSEFEHTPKMEAQCITQEEAE